MVAKVRESESLVSKSVARSFTILLLNCPECGGRGGWVKENLKVPCPTCFAARNFLESRFNFKVGERNET